MAAESVNAIVTSPPYWPMKRAYGGKGIGFEPTLGEYLSDLVQVFNHAKRVLRNDGVMWIIIDDGYSAKGGKWSTNGFHKHRPGKQKSVVPEGVAYPDTTDTVPEGNLLIIPSALAFALRDDGWIFVQKSFGRRDQRVSPSQSGTELRRTMKKS